MPSPRAQWREPSNNFWLLIGDDFVHIDDIVITIGHVITVGIIGVHRVRIYWVVRSVRSEV